MMSAQFLEILIEIAILWCLVGMVFGKKKRSKFEVEVVQASDYHRLQELLLAYGKQGYRIVRIDQHHYGYEAVLEREKIDG